MIMNSVFVERVKEYFGKDADRFLKLLDEKSTQGFFLNTNKAKQEDILKMIDFDYHKSDVTDYSFYHNSDNIGKSKVYELGLIYPQEIAASMPSTFVDTKDIKTIVDMCSAPGGKSINILNKVDKNVLCICNDCNHSRSSILSSNLERLGLDNVIVTNKKTNDLANCLDNFADLVILDAPCSGEGMIRKYPEILNDYSINNIETLASVQNVLLEEAYKMLKGGGQLLYSTCTYAFEEDENQIINFLNKHGDMHIVEIYPSYYSTLKGTVKLSPLNNTEGQFICLMSKKNNSIKSSFKYLKSIKEPIVDSFIKNNLNINNYYLYKHNEHYYLSLIPLIDIGNNVLKYGIYIGDIVNKRFEPAHNMYRSNSLRTYFKYIYDLSDEEYIKYTQGYELKVTLDNNYYLITYKGYSLGFGKCSNNQLKNKYPKGLRMRDII